MTLTEFLLDRIAEDERWARRRRDEDFVKHRISARRLHHDPDDSDRVLARCAADREIIAAANRPGDAAGEAVMAFVLGRLASAYAAHPDYRDEWRS